MIVMCAVSNGHFGFDDENLNHIYDMSASAHVHTVLLIIYLFSLYFSMSILYRSNVAWFQTRYDNVIYDVVYDVLSGWTIPKRSFNRRGVLIRKGSFFGAPF